ncbi:MAG: copper resistance protein CopC [Aeromicrobium sp.]|uniref:copper resistance CopC/CopD family protein n=1 Tax=Aeromicrobium sp. TaxID=1871063 RepID=UPI0039E417A7
MSMVTRWARVIASAGLLLALGWLLAASPASAHASLVSTDPADGAVLPDSPESITLTFTEPVRLTDGIELLTADGAPVEATVEGSDAVVTITPSEPLSGGTHIVGWRVISADSHPIAGGFSFSVGAPSATSVELPTAEAPRDVDLLRKAAEATRYGGVLAATGLLAFALLVARPALDSSPVARRRLRRVGVGAGVVAAVSAMLLAPLTTLWQSAAPLSRFGRALADDTTWSGDTALAATVLIAGLVLVALALRRAPAVALAGATVALGSLAVIGHTRTFGPVPLVLTADLLHVVAAALWAGGLVGLTILFSAGRDVRAVRLADAVRRFSALALGSVAVLTASGLLLWWRVPATVTDLPDSSYGVHLLVKVALVVVLVGVGAWNLHVVRGSLSVGRLRRTVGAEVALVGLVVAVTAGLVTQVPPSATADAQAGPARESFDLDLGEAYDATLTLTPGLIGTNAAQLTIVDADGQPVTALEPPTVSVGIEEFDLGPFTHELAEVAPGSYEGSVDLPIEGDWRIAVAVRVSTYERPSDAVVLEVAP